MSDDASKLLPTVFNITSGKESFEFTIPGITSTIQLGVRARAIRRRFDPSSGGDEYGLDPDAADLAWGCAAFEILLKGCDAPGNWPYSKATNGTPVVDYTKFPDDMLDVVLEVSRKLSVEITTFRAKRIADRQPAGTETVAGVGDPGVQPVSP